MNFTTFRNAIIDQFNEMSKSQLFVTSTDKETIWNLYLSSFPEGSNPIFRERTEHDCQCCKSFIRSIGNVVSISPEGQLISIWDVSIPGIYQQVADELSAYVKSKPIRNILLKSESRIGVKSNVGISPEGVTETWNHFYLDLSSKYVTHATDIGTKLSEAQSSYDVFLRGLQTITMESLDIVIDLINQNSLYRGEEHLFAVKAFKTLLKESNKLFPEELPIFAWTHFNDSGARIRNTVIGTLLTDISENVDLEVAVSKYESKVAPTNYKRPKALITKSMISKAQKAITDLGLIDSLPRRYANIDDISINNVLFADSSVRKNLDVFDELKEAIPENLKSIKHAEEISIENFISNVLPTTQKIELLFEHHQINNLVSLIAPQNENAPNITKWSNNFTWSYNGEVADSLIKNKVKSHGGNVTGPLRFSINWAEGEWSSDNSDLDAWATEPNGTRIGFSTEYRKDKSNLRTYNSGQLDVDIITPSSFNNQNIVENIIWTNKDKMSEGLYTLYVDPYSNRNSQGFKAEVEIDGIIYSYLYNKPVNMQIKVAEVILKNGNFSIKHFVPMIESSVMEYWNISTNKFHTVKTLMYSPNHWDNQSIGNRHYFFILENCLNPDSSRGFYNEFLPESLTEHRKVFEILGSKMRTNYTDNQISGLGFSSTKRNHVFCKVSGSFSRMLKITF